MRTLSRMSAFLAALVLAQTWAILPAAAEEYVALASNNATVWPSGPRPGPNGKRFFNIEGRNNFDAMGNSVASFGVADFSRDDLGLPGPITKLTSVYLVLSQSNAAFTRNGNIKVFVVDDVDTDIEPGTSPLAFDLKDPSGLGEQFSTRWLVSEGTFKRRADGDPDFYELDISDPKLAEYLLKQLNSKGALIRLVICPDKDDDVAATYAGYTNDMILGPVLIINAK